jgi:hypothetical protein
MRRGQVAVQDNYNQLVAESQVNRHFETVYVPGLLQTPDYARRILTEMVELRDLNMSDVDAAVASRMQRQQLLYDTSKRFEFLLAEPVLRWLLCPPTLCAVSSTDCKPWLAYRTSGSASCPSASS